MNIAGTLAVQPPRLGTVASATVPTPQGFTASSSVRPVARRSHDTHPTAPW
jgi:hypothetical protein